MVETRQTTVGPRRSGLRRRLTQVVAVCGINLGVLAVAGPSWAGPLMGC